MCKYLYTHTCIISLFLCFLHKGHYLYAQTPAIDAPEGTFTNGACASSFANNFDITFDFSGTIFNAGNDFIIELSDANGDFDVVDPINVGTITNNDYNEQFNNIPGSFSLPEGTSGDAYRIRIRSTDPEVIGTPSAPFPAYIQPDVSISSLTSTGDSSICDGEPVTLSITLSDSSEDVNAYEYRWRLNGVDILGEDGPTLTIDEPGSYSVAFQLGACNNVSQFRSLLIESSEIESISIQGEDAINICSDETYELVASVDNTTDYNYQWFVGDEPISGATESSYITPDTNQYGTYHLEISNAEGCTAVSEDVVIAPKGGADYTVSIDGDSTRVILPEETMALTATVDTNSTSLEYRWYRDNELFSGGETLDISVFDVGEFYLEVTDTSSECSVSVSSDLIIVLEAVSLLPVIRTDTEYVECGAVSTELSLVTINAIATDNQEYPLSEDQLAISSFSLQWFKDGVEITGATTESLNIESYNENGIYSLGASVGGGVSELSGESELLDVLLSPETIITSSSDSNQLCPGTVINLSVNITEGYTYTWFKDDELLTVEDVSSIDVEEVGNYYVTFDGFGCQNTTASVEIIEFTDDSLEVFPSTLAVLIAGETTTLSATGADAYEWYDSEGNLLSTFDEVEVVTTGVYTLVGTVENCKVEKEIEVVEDDGSFTVPNIISPFNGDAANNTWKIPNKFSYQPSVNVVVYDSRGKEVLNTVDYQNNWPEDISDFRGGMLFYFKIIKENALIKAGTISVLE